MIKVIACAEGRKQPKYAEKGDSTSPTVSTEALIITETIESKENHNVVVINTPTRSFGPNNLTTKK